MTVGELLLYLKDLDPTLPVLVDGYEHGAHILKAENVTVTKYRENDWGAAPDWGGPHEILTSWRLELDEASADWDDPKTNRVLPCLHIGR